MDVAGMWRLIKQTIACFHWAKLQNEIVWTDFSCTALRWLPRLSLTFSIGLRVTVVAAQPLKQRSHHFGAAEALEPGPNVLVVPFQSADLQDPGRRKPQKLDLKNGKKKRLDKKKTLGRG